MSPESNPIVVQFAASLTIAERTLLLSGGNTPDDAAQVYQGKLLPGGPSLDLKDIANRVLGESFHLQLPSSFPRILVDTLSATITRQPKPSGHETAAGQAFAAPAQPPAPLSSYEFSASSATVVPEPFGHSIPVQFQGFAVSLKSVAGAAATAFVLTSTVVPQPQGHASSWLGSVSGLLLLVDGQSAASFSMAAQISVHQLLHDLLGCTVPEKLESFLPTFSPQASDLPMRMYYASSDISYHQQEGQTYSYVKGFNFDQCVVNILDHDFCISLNWTSRQDYGFSASVGILDFYFFTVSSPPVPACGLGGPVVQVQQQNSALTIGLTANLNFHDMEALSLDVAAQWDSSAKAYVFAGTIVYQDSILGLKRPSLGIAWSKASGFRFTNFPIPSSKLEQFIDFAKELQKMKPRCGCQALTAFVFKRAITTKFSLDVALGSGTKPAGARAPNARGLAISVGGTYTIFILGQAICSVAFGPINIKITGDVPQSLDCLGSEIVSTLHNNAQALVQSLWDNQTAFFQLLAAQALEQGGKQVVSNLLCNAGGKEAGKSVVTKTASNLVHEAGTGAMDTLAAAAQAYAAATAALSFFASIIKCITGAQRKERNAAKERQDAARSRIDQLLAINGFSVRYELQEGQCRAVAEWAPLSVTDPAASLLLTLTDAAANIHTCYEPAINDSRYTLPTPLEPGNTYKLTLCGNYQYNGSTYSGAAVSAKLRVGILSLDAFLAVYEPGANTVTVKWPPAKGFMTPNKVPIEAVSYKLTLRNSTTDSNVPGFLASILVPPEAPANYRHCFSLVPTVAPYFIPEANTQYQVQLQVLANHSVFDAVRHGPDFAASLGIGHTLLGLSFQIK